MELNADDAMLTMLDRHDLTVGRPGADAETIRDRGAIDHERVIARYMDRRGEAGEHARAVVIDRRRAPVLRSARAHNRRAVRRAYTLMTETHTEDRNRRTEATHELCRDAGLSRRARPRRQHDVARSERLHFIERERIVAADERVAAQLADVAREVMDERIVVVDQKDHLRTPLYVNH